MCGRSGYVQDGKATAEQLHAQLRSASAEPSYNVAPRQHAPVVVQEGGTRYLNMYRWGLIPFTYRASRVTPFFPNGGLTHDAVS